MKKDEYGRYSDDYIVANTTKGAETEAEESDQPLIGRKELGIDEKNYTPLRASRHIVGYVKEHD